MSVSPIGAGVTGAATGLAQVNMSSSNVSSGEKMPAATFLFKNKDSGDVFVLSHVKKDSRASTNSQPSENAKNDTFLAAVIELFQKFGYVMFSPQTLRISESGGGSN